MKQEQKFSDQILKQNLIDGIPVGLKALYMTCCPVLFDYISTMKHPPELNDKFFCTQLLSIISMRSNSEDLINSFFEWMYKFSENAPKDVEADYRLLCDESRRDITMLILLSAIDLISEALTLTGKSRKLSAQQYQLFDMIFTKAERRVTVSTKLKIPIKKLREILNDTLDALT